MTSGTADPGVREMLAIQYPGCRFYIDRAAVTSSLYLEAVRPLDAPVGGLRERVDHGGRPAAIFNLDERLCDLFGLPKSDRVVFALVVDTGDWDLLFRKRFRERVLSANPDLWDRRLVLRIRSALLERMALSALRPIPKGLRARYYREGIIACRFPEEGGTAFLLDIERLIFQPVAGD